MTGDPYDRMRRRAESRFGEEPGMTDEFTRSPNPHRLYRDTRRKVLGGVLAGLSDYMNVDVAILRIIAVVLFFVPPTSGFVIIGYLVAWIAIPCRPESARRPVSPEEDVFWRGVSRRPQATFSNLRYTFRDLEERLRTVERVVTSEEWRLRREFRDLER